MHAQITDFLKRFVRESGINTMSGQRVVEIGSYDLNGSAREVLQPGTAEYVGVDWRAGPGVDVVSLGHEYQPEHPFDVAVSCQALEHDPHWRSTLASLVRAVVDAPSGTGRVIVTCAGPGYVVHELETAPPRPGHPDEPWYENRSIDDVRNGLAVAAIVMGLDYTIEATTDRDGLDVLVWMTIWCQLGAFQTPGDVQRKLGEHYAKQPEVSLEERARTFAHAYVAAGDMVPEMSSARAMGGGYWSLMLHQLRDHDDAFGTVDLVYICLTLGLVQLDDAVLDAWRSAGMGVSVRCGLRDREALAGPRQGQGSGPSAP